MHIADGILHAPTLIAGAAATAGGLGVGLAKLKPRDIPKTGVLSALFFVASLVHVPIGPVSQHLILTGVIGLFLGWAAYPAVFVGLLLQFLLLNYGGLTTLGVNTFIMATPAVIVYYAFRGLVARRDIGRSAWIVSAGGAAAGFFGVLIGAMLLAIVLATGDDALIPVAKLSFVVHLPIAGIEGVIGLFLVNFVRVVKPDLLRPAEA